MIQKLIITDPKTTPVPWADETIREPREFVFGPGMTILWGPNACGKSTLLSIMARLTCCEQGGVSTITQTALSALRREGKLMSRLLADGASLVSDGSAVRYINPSNKIGLVGGAFDDDFFGHGIANAMRKGSAGQDTIAAMHDQLAPWPPQPVDKVGWVNDHWQFVLDFARQQFKPGVIPVGPPTMLLDEPETHLSLPNQVNLWESLVGISKKCQIIVATHSVFGLNVPGAVYMDLEPGYLEECRKAVAGLSRPAGRGGKKKCIP